MSGWDFPSPGVGDEAVAPEQQDPALRVAHHHTRGRSRHAHDMVLEAFTARDLDIDEAQVDPIALVHGTLALNVPAHSGRNPTASGSIGRLEEFQVVDLFFVEVDKKCQVVAP